MLANLIDNACKWASGAIVVRGFIDAARGQDIIAVEDDGPGLPPEAMDVVFRIGERLDEQVPGSARAAIVRDLAELYGGEVRLENPRMAAA